MLSSKFLFIGKIFTSAFILINIVNIFPFRIFDISYYTIIFTTILDTATLLLIGISLPRYVFANEFRILNELKNKNLIDSNDNEKIKFLQIKNFNIKKISYYIALFFLIITLANPIILLVSINRIDNNLSNFLISLEDNFKSKKNQIEELILISKNNQVNKEELEKLENSIKDLSITKDKQINNFIEINNQNKFDNTKIIVRNILLALLWSLAFYKIYKI